MSLATLSDFGAGSTSSEATIHLVDNIRREWLTIVDSLSELVLLVDQDGSVRRANRAVEAWGLGQVKTLRGAALHEVLHPLCRKGRNCYIEASLRQALAPHNAFEPVEYETQDLQLGRSIRLTVRPLSRDTENPAKGAAVVILRDATEEERSRRQESRRHHYEAMGHLVHGLAHEIGNPLAAMKASVQVLEKNFDRFSPDKKVLYLRRIINGIERLELLVDNTLHGSTLLEPDHRVEVGEVLRHVAELFLDEMREKRIRFRTVSLDSPCQLLADPGALEQVLVNVLRNAVEACHEGDSIELEASLHNDRVRIRVDDTGPGISHRDLPNIFSPYFTTKPRGSGIGLAHTNHLVEGMQGAIEILSEEGNGTTVLLTFRKANPDNE